LVLPVRETERRLASSRAWFLCHPYGSENVRKMLLRNLISN